MTDNELRRINTWPSLWLDAAVESRLCSRRELGGTPYCQFESGEVMRKIAKFAELITAPLHEEIDGKFDEADSETMELIRSIVVNFHFRDGHKNSDGSLGTISISPKQFRDCLASMRSITK
jgi:hypothetical protein